MFFHVLRIKAKYQSEKQANIKIQITRVTVIAISVQITIKLVPSTITCKKNTHTDAKLMVCFTTTAQSMKI